MKKFKKSEIVECSFCGRIVSIDGKKQEYDRGNFCTHGMTRKYKDFVRVKK